MTDRIVPKLIAEAKRLGAEGVHVEHGGKHPKIKGLIRGRLFVHVAPYSASDTRSEKNALADLRRALGGRPKRKPRPPRDKTPKDQCKPDGVEMTPTANVPEDRFYGRLRRIRTAME